ncbi:MAG: choice-of-anchor Q domain-containing protein [Reichenbachiella sp.]|uniref:choice-of-anchor Q domain-containing protein n=1 Tax=Reichenbachiella sp. TaxID=2184521 RepID=UPI00296729A9|nr:choice-of-anchor Q domain-containing protein [Reichenbachiella sp.]MDW3208329.1 choice-of-anchor Q domain-containing protein [Reichenbachiella sp.]
MKYALTTTLLIYSLTLLSQELVIEPSRTAGVAPLYVFFDGTSSTGLEGVNDLPNADFSWDFDVNNAHSSGNWELTKGMVAGHVFEEPGTYTVSCTMIARNGSVDKEEVTITVSEFSGTTYYVSNEGSDSNDGLSEVNPWATANHALAQLAPNARVLFRRNDTFEGIDFRIRNLNEGVKILGAYGSGNDPVLRNALGNPVIDITACSDLIVMDLHLWVNDYTDGTSNNSNRGLRAEESSNILALRLEIDDAASFATYQDDGDLLGIFDCYIHDIGTIGIFSSDSRRLSWVGNTIDGMETTQPEHGMRLQGGEKQFIAHSKFMNIPDVKTTLTVRGDGQRHIMIYKNHTDRIIQVAPTDHNLIQHVSLATIEANYIGANPAYQNVNYPPPISAINVLATEVVVRNNVIDGMRRGVTISLENPAVIPGDIDIYNNTMNWRNVMEASGTIGTMMAGNQSVNVTVRNNLMAAPSTGEMQIYDGHDNTNLVVSDNLMTVSPNYETDELPGSASHINSVSNFKLAESSPAINQGALDVPVYFDQTGGKRYYGSAPDLGAFEFDDGGDSTNPDPTEGRNEVLGLAVIKSLKLFPNPASMFLQIDDQHLGKKVVIISIEGKVVARRSKLDDTQLDVSGLPLGLYLFIVGGGKERLVGRFIKQ